MKRTVLIVFVSFILLSLFNSCQKEDYGNMNVKLIAYQPSNDGSMQWVISGRVLSSGKVDFTDHGFEVTIGGEKRRYPLGELKKSGKVEYTIEVPGGFVVTNVVFYAVDKNGNSYFSDSGLTPVTFISHSHFNDVQADYFQAAILNTDTNNYAVTSYGIEYRLQGSDASTPWTHYDYVTSYFPSSTVPVNIQIMYNMNFFTPTVAYEYRIFAVYVKISDVMYSTAYSGVGTFVADQPL